MLGIVHGMRKSVQLFFVSLPIILGQPELNLRVFFYCSVEVISRISLTVFRICFEWNLFYERLEFIHAQSNSIWKENYPYHLLLQVNSSR